MTKTSRGLASLLVAALLVLGCAVQAPHPVAASSAAGRPAAGAAATAPAIPGNAPVIIVGAGLTGLTVAYELKKDGIDSLLLESSPRAGGRIQTVTFTDGATAEAHMEEYFAGSPAYPLLLELGFRPPPAEPTTLIEDVAHSSVRLDGRIYPYQGDGDRDTYLKGIFNDEERAAWLRWNSKVVALHDELKRSYYDGKPLPPDLVALTQVSFRDWMAAAGLPHKVSEWWRVTVEPEMAIEWDQISALDAIDEMRLFLDTAQGFGEKNYHVAAGNTAFTSALAARLDQGRIVTNARVTAVQQDATGVTLRVLDHDSHYFEVRGQVAVVTVPISQIGRIQFTPPLEPDKRRAIDTERMGSYVKVHLRMAPGAERLWTVDGENILTLLSDSLAGSIYDVGHLHHADGSEQDGILTLLLHARFAREVMSLPADEIRERTVDALDAVFPGARGYVKSAEIFVYPQAVAYWPLEQGRSRFDFLANELRRPQGRLYIGGDTTDDSHSEGAVRAAQRIARDISGHRAELALEPK